MFRSMSVTNDRGETLLLDIFDPFSTGINVIDIDGIGPGKATINSLDIYGRDGAYFNSARKPMRDITISLEFLDKPSVEAVRHKTYKYFPIKREVTLVFKTDERELYITGKVESNEPKIFQQKESTAIVINCFDPDFRKVVRKEEAWITFSSLQGGFEFPFSNEVGAKSLHFGDIVTNNTATIDYEGDSPTGLLVEMAAAYGPVVDPYIENITTGEKFSISTERIPGGRNFLLGDAVHINTNPGQKNISHMRGEVDTPSLRAILPGSKWLNLVPGENMFVYNAASGLENLDVRMAFDTRFDGV